MNYQFFLFDFDGLLVNTEHLHHEAYLRTLSVYGYDLGWSFADFCRICHPDAKGSSKAIGAQFPELVKRFGWETLYRQKGDHYLTLLQEGRVSLMPGAHELLKGLAERGIKRAVVTHAQPQQIALIREQVPILNSIPHWITRDQYTHAKPHPESYLKALQLKEPGERVIGFEDSLRGLKALHASGVEGAIVCPSDYPFLPEALELGAFHLKRLPLVEDLS